MMNAQDRLHPTVKGYQVWADALKPVLTELLGARAAADHAPPPTGEPGASRGWRQSEPRTLERGCRGPAANACVATRSLTLGARIGVSPIAHRKPGVSPGLRRIGIDR